MNSSSKNSSEKPESFDGKNFKRWQQKLRFYLTVQRVVEWITSTRPVTIEGEEPPSRAKLERWDHKDYMCRNYILNCLSLKLYDVYAKCPTAKELWNSLEKKYGTEDAGSKKFVVGRFLEYKMEDNKSVVSQVDELQIIVHEIQSEGYKICEGFQVAAIIEKLPPSWKDYKSSLKHKRHEMTMEDLIMRIRIEEDNKMAEQKEKATELNSKANLVEGKPRNTQKPSGHKHGGHKPRNNQSQYGNKKVHEQNRNSKPHFKPSTSSFSGTALCFVCGKPGHIAKNCKHRKTSVVKHQANVAEEEGNFSAVVTEVNLVSNKTDWWVDSGATKHICCTRGAFSTFIPLEEGERLYMGNSATSEVKGKGTVILKFTSGNILTLKDVLYAPDVRKNLVSGFVLVKKGFKIVFESDKVVLSKGGSFVGKGYADEGLFKLNVSVIDNNNNNASSSAYLIDSVDMWHVRLGHVNNASIKRLMFLGNIPKSNLNSDSKCEICVESKCASKPHPKVERSSTILSLIHSDVCDLKGYVTRGGNKYFVTFIDDYSKYCTVFLLKSKDECLSKFIAYKTEVENQLEHRIKVIRSDRGGEYETGLFDKFCEENGIVHETTPPYSPQSNGVAERKNRTLKNMVNSMLNTSGLPF